MAHATSSNSSIFPEFTSDQWKAISKLIHEKSAESGSNKLSGKKGYGDVILDTRTSHHMTEKLSLLTTLESTPPCSVGFPDGGKTLSLSKGLLPL